MKQEKVPGKNARINAEDVPEQAVRSDDRFSVVAEGQGRDLKTRPAVSGRPNAGPVDADQDWNRVEQIPEELVLQAQRLVSAAGSIERARQVLDSLESR